MSTYNGYDDDDYEEVDIDYEDEDDCPTEIYGGLTFDNTALVCCKLEDVIERLEEIVDLCEDSETQDAIKIAVNCLQNELRNRSSGNDL